MSTQMSNPKQSEAKERTISKANARKAAHTIVAAAIHGAIHAGMTSRFNATSSARVHEELMRMLDQEDALGIPMGEEGPYLEAKIKVSR